MSGFNDDGERPWWGKFVGIAISSKMIDNTPTGTLRRGYFKKVS